MIFEKLVEIVSSDGSDCRVCDDSRRVSSGDCYVAVRGVCADGHDFIDQAIDKGAKYIVTERPIQTNSAEVVVVEDSAMALAELAQAASGNPARKLINLAVTGTNGKTTVAFLVRSIIISAKQRCGLIGTVVYDTGRGERKASLTTPGTVEIAALQKEMVDAGLKYMAIEASSHALSQHRLERINFAVAAFTNLTGDHLDYHGDMEKYLQAKCRLFAGLSKNATAILNADSPYSCKIAKQTSARVLYYGIDAKADITAEVESMDLTGSVYHLRYEGKSVKVKNYLTGMFNISNQLTAAGICIAAGFSLDGVAAGLEGFKAVPGRLERIVSDKPFSVFVDYAHTDDALRNVLCTLRPMCSGRLIVVFGCGGDRDKSKRPRMAAAVQEFADIVIVTSDNPRNEKPESIIDDILAGFKNADSENIIVEQDRQKAISAAISMAKSGDIVLIAGKGHEGYQIIGTEKIHFDDRETVLEILGSNV